MSPLVESAKAAAASGGATTGTVLGGAVVSNGVVTGVETQSGKAGETSKITLSMTEASAKSLAMDATATGLAATAAGTGATAYGSWANASATNGTAIGFRAVASGAGSVAVGFENQVTGSQSTAIGYRNVVFGSNSGAFGDPNTIGSDGTVVLGGSTVAANSVTGSYVVGNNNNVQSSNVFVLGNNVNVAAGNDGAVVLGNGSTASGPNTVSVGAAGAERRITNVAPGVNGTDAVNVNQLNNVAGAVNNLSTQLAETQRVAYTGVAMSMAMAGNYMPGLAPGESAMGVGVGGFKGYGALSLNFKHFYKDGRMTFGAGVSTNGKDSGVSAGISWKW